MGFPATPVHMRNRLILSIGLLLLVPATGAAQVRAGAPYVRLGTCEGEGCGFGTVIALRALDVHAAEGQVDAVVFRIREGERFETLVSNLHFRRVGGVIVSSAVLLVEEGDTLGWVQPGDTLPVLAYAGEGYYEIWFGGAVHVLAKFWDDGREFPRRQGLPGQLVIEPIVETWAEVRNVAGRTGWVLGVPGEDYVDPEH
jgi:hypothetical protein